MHITSVTDLRQNASKVIARVVSTGEPAVVLQRSRPVVYLVEASLYEEMAEKARMAEEYIRMAETRAALRNLAALRTRMARRGVQSDSTPLIRALREGKLR